MTNALWYLGRGSGVTALVLFTIVLSLGVLVRAGRALPGLPRFAVAAVHRTTSLTALVFLSLHMLLLLFDPYAQLRVLDFLVPFDAAYRPVWQGFGTLAFELVVVLIVTSLLRHRIGLRVWRVLHWTAYACWPVAVLHAVGNGTDRTSPWLLAIVGACVGVVVVAIGYRTFGHFDEEFRAPSVAPPQGLAGLR